MRFLYCHVYGVWLHKGFGLEITFIDHLQIVATTNYNIIANHTLQITTAHAKPSQSRIPINRIIREVLIEIEGAS
jgi:hypothetical protein